MSPSLLFWIAVATGNLVLLATGLVWWLTNWKWALVFLLGGPCVVVGFACFALILFFFLDGGVARAVPCEAGCGRLAPVQLRGTRYHRQLCDQCERQARRTVATRAVEEWKL